MDEEPHIRKQIWERKDLVDAKVSEPEFLELPDDPYFDAMDMFDWVKIYKGLE